MNFPRLPLAALTCVVLFGLATQAQAQSASQMYADAIASYNGGDVPAAKHKLQLTLEVDPNFRAASALLSKINVEERQGLSQASVVSAASLARVLLPVEFKDTTLATAVEFLRQRIVEQTGGKLQPNFVLKLPPEFQNKHITLHLDHAPATEIMRYMGDLAGVDFRVEQYAIVVVPVSASPVATASPTSSVP